MRLALLTVLSILTVQGVACAKQPKLPPTPPNSPLQDEHVIDGRGDPVVAQCVSIGSYMREHLHSKILKIAITHSPKWGTIWRADMASPLGDHYSPMIWRIICTERMIVTIPLEAYDPRQNIRRL